MAEVSIADGVCDRVELVGETLNVPLDKRDDLLLVTATDRSIHLYDTKSLAFLARFESAYVGSLILQARFA